MNEKSDAQLLRAYAENRDEAAFCDLVARHTDFVYAAAVRQVGCPATGADIAQGVFTELARKAARLTQSGHASESLAGWLHRATRYAALNQVRDARRRSANERQAMDQLITNSEPTAEWEQIRPALDEALDSLGEADREALLLRYFQNRDFRDLGSVLGVSDDAAQKRVSRALERLRDFFAKRGLAASTGALAAFLAANTTQAAPTGLAATLSASALAGAGAAASTTTVVVKTITMTTLQKTALTAALVVLAGAGFYEARQSAQWRTRVQALEQQQAPLAEQIQQLQRERDEATNRLAGVLAQKLLPAAEPKDLLKLRGEVAGLRTALASAQQTAAAAASNGNAGSVRIVVAGSSNGVIQLDPSQLSVAGFRPSAATNLAFTDVNRLQNAGNATAAAGAQTALWDVLQNQGQSFGQIAYHDPQAPEDSVSKLLGHLAVELSGTTQVSIGAPQTLGAEYSLVPFVASGLGGADGNAKTTQGMLGFRRGQDGWYLERYNPQSQGLILNSR